MTKLASKAYSFLRAYSKDRRGASAIIFAVTLPAMVGLIGLGTEVGYWYMSHRNIQSAADVAAIAGALELRGGASSSNVTYEAGYEAGNNGWDSSLGTATVTFPGTRTVQVELTENRPRLFSALFSQDSTQAVRVVAQAQYQSGGPACVLALSGLAVGALTLTGNTSVDLTACNMMSNSNDSSSIIQTGSSDVLADCVYAAGGIDHNSNMVTTQCANPIENAAPSVDPYADLMVPLSPAACTSVPNFSPNDTFAMTPGRYCSDVSMKGTVNLAPGTYIFDSGDFDANSNAVITGTDVTIIMTGGGVMHFNGSAEINLSAPSTGAYSGVLFYQDQNEPDAINTINGNSNSSFQGLMYFPSQEVRILGNGNTGPGCSHLIANTIYFSGTSSFGNNCTGAGTREIEIVGGVDLIL